MYITIDREKYDDPEKRINGYAGHDAFYPRTLKSVVLQCYSRTKIDYCMANYINEIIRRNISHLECLWVPIEFKGTGFISVPSSTLKKINTWVFSVLEFRS